MDNGHKNAIFSVNPDMENSLNQENWSEENWQHSLEISKPLDMPAPEKFEKVETPVIVSEAPVKTLEAAPIASSLERNTPEDQPLGQITPTTPQINPAITRVNYNPANIRTTGDHLEKTTLKEVDGVIERLSQTGDLNNFYEEIRGEDSMLEANLNNSFNRKLYHEGEEPVVGPKLGGTR